MGKPAWWLVVGAGGLAGCNPSLAAYCAPGTPECSADGGASDGTVGVRDAKAADAAACEAAKSPSEDPCVVAEAYGVFVSPTGSDANPGTRAAPVVTIGHGMNVAKAAGKRVYVCAGSFAESLVVTASRDGVNVYGALDCATWGYGTGNKVVVAPSAAGYALELSGLVTGVTFEDVEFDAHSANPPNAGASSIAVFVSGSQNVALQRVTMVAGNAANGSPGASGGPSPDGGASGDPSNWFGTPPSYAELDGISAGDAGGAPSAHCTCSDQSETSGGQGGGPMNIPKPGAGTPSYGDAGAGAGGTNAVSCGNGGIAQNGGNAPDPAADLPTMTLGAASATGWAPGIGVTGTDGKPGQGGGGGGNGQLSTGSGGGGACGGCGGAGGKPGAGGGSSMALLAYQSSVALVSCVLTAKAAGNGGAGGGGEAGQGGGSPGMPSGSGAGIGCPGGVGGAGAGGNGGQGGPGGLSLGIGYYGTAPTIDGTVISRAASLAGVTLGNAGSGGAGGSKGAAASDSTGPAGADGAPGQTGIAAAVESLP
jgi:hypothetical protein